MNQVEAATELGLSEATVSRYCSGERRPPIDTLYVIRRVLRWSIEAQVDALRCGTYAQEFTDRIARRRPRRRSVETSAVRRMRAAGSGGNRVSPLGGDGQKPGHRG